MVPRTYPRTLGMHALILTMAGMHYVLAADGSGALTPVAATEFARDRAFGFGASRLAEYVEEKSVARGAGRATKAEEVHAVTIETIRSGGPEAVAAQMLALPAAGRHACVRARVRLGLGLGLGLG